MIQIRCEHTEMLDRSKCIPHIKNRNKHSQEQIDRLAFLIQHHGFRHPIIISKLSGMVVAGHGRLQAATQLSMAEVPVDYQDFENEEQEYAFLVSDNSIALWAELDLLSIQNDLKDLPNLDINLLGIKDFKLIEPEKLEPGCDENEVPEHVESITKLGDCYLLGAHRLLCGDSTSIDAVEKLMNGEKADMVFTDPPYGVGYKYNSHDDNVTKEEHAQFLKDLIGLSLTICERMILTPGGKNLEIVTKIREAQHIGCWTKINAMSPGRITHFWTWEPIFFFGKWPKKRGNDVFNYCSGKQTDTGDHTCPKPYELWHDLMDNFSEPNQKILDLFGGSGTTLIACEKTNRKCFMMEIDPHYCDVIVSRWEKYTGKKAELISGQT